MGVQLNPKLQRCKLCEQLMSGTTPRKTSRKRLIELAADGIITERLKELATENTALRARVAELESSECEQCKDLLTTARHYKDRVAELEAELTSIQNYEVAFVRHIESHLHGNQLPCCKICGMTITDIARERGE